MCQKHVHQHPCSLGVFRQQREISEGEGQRGTQGEDAEQGVLHVF